VTAPGYLRERHAAAGQPDPSGDGDTAGSAPLHRLAGLAGRVPWCWPVLLTVALGFYQVGRPALWRDELASWSFATRPIPRLLAAAHHTGATQLPYYVLLHFWIEAFGASADAMRTLSVLTMAGAAACVTLAGRRLAGVRAGLIAGLVFALVPSVSRFAQEVRFYSLEVLVATLATLLLLRALDQPSLRRWVVYAVCLTALGYVDLVALSVVTGHGAAVAMRWRRDRDRADLGFVPAAVGAVCLCYPLAVVGSDQARGQVSWIARPGLDLTTFAFFGRNLFYSTSVAAALILLALVAWAVARREAAFMTAIAVVPVAAVWLVSQGPHSYFFPRYLLLTVAAWAVLAGIALSRLDARVAAAGVLVVAILGAGDQQVIRTPGAHNWAYYPVGVGGGYFDYRGAARIIAMGARPSDGVVYQSRARWLLINYGVEYYLERDLPHGSLPRQLLIAESSTQAGTLYPVWCRHPAACVGQEPRIWVVGSGRQDHLAAVLTPAQAAALRPNYRVSGISHVEGLTVFLLART
jgi:mannosyltransferase